MNAESLQSKINILKASYDAMGVSIELLEAELKMLRKRSKNINELDWQNLPLTISLKDAAGVLGVGYSTARGFMKDPTFPAVKRGKRILVNTEELKRWAGG